VNLTLVFYFLGATTNAAVCVSKLNVFVTIACIVLFKAGLVFRQKMIFSRVESKLHLGKDMFFRSAQKCKCGLWPFQIMMCINNFLYVL